MSTYKYIYWHESPKGVSPTKDGKREAMVHLLVGYNPGRILDFQAMADTLRETFPEAKNEDIRCGQVTKSSYVDGFSIIRWNACLPEEEYKGWSQYGRKGEGYKVEYFSTVD